MCLVSLVTVRDEEISAQEREKRKGKRYDYIYIYFSMSVRMKGEKEKGRLTINNLTVYPNYKFR